MALLTLAFLSGPAFAQSSGENCYVSRSAYSTQVRCPRSGTTTIMENNTRAPSGANALPSDKRLPTVITPDNRFCQQIGSVWSCK